MQPTQPTQPTEPALTTLQGFDNARDLGGTACAGGVIAPGRLVRSETPLPPAAVDTSQSEQFVRIIDLRSQPEVEQLPHPFGAATGYRNLPLIDPSPEIWRELPRASTLDQIYRHWIERSTATIEVLMAEIADAPDGTVLVCCAAGKDRTGVVVAMLLRLAGVADTEIEADYAATEPMMRGRFAAELDAVAEPSERERLTAFQAALPTTIRGVLGHLDAAYGSVASYLRSIGLTERQVDALRSRFVQS